MVGTTCSQGSQLPRPFRPREGERVGIIGVVSDYTAIRRQSAAQCRQNLNRYILAVGKRRMLEPAEQNPLLRLMLLNKLTHLVDGMEAVQIALALRRTPGEQTVAAKNDAVGPRILLNSVFNQIGRASC